MKKRIEKKLALNKSTLVNLDTSDMTVLKGGQRWESKNEDGTCNGSEICTYSCTIVNQGTICL